MQGAGHTGPVNSIFYDYDDHIFSCGIDANLICWSVSQCSQISSVNFKHEIPHIVIRIPDTNNLILAGRYLKMYDFIDQEIVHSFTGHSSIISVVKHFVLDSKNYILTGSQSDRILSLWSLNCESENKNSIASFLMENVCISLSCRVINDSILKIGAVSRNGVLQYFTENFEDMKREKPIKPKVTLEIVSNAKTAVEAIPSVVTSLNFGMESDDTALVGYGSKQFLRFETFSISLKSKNQLEIRSDPRKLKASEGQAEKKFGMIDPIIQNDQIEYHTATSAIKKATKSVNNTICIVLLSNTYFESSCYNIIIIPSLFLTIERAANGNKIGKLEC